MYIFFGYRESDYSINICVYEISVTQTDLIGELLFNNLIIYLQSKIILSYFNTTNSIKCNTSATQQQASNQKPNYNGNPLINPAISLN